MQTITTIGLDIAKSVFQVHGVDATGQVVIRRQLKRRSVLAFFQKLPPEFKAGRGRNFLVMTPVPQDGARDRSGQLCKFPRIPHPS